MTGSPVAPTKRTALLGLVGACHPVPSLAVTAVAVLLAIGVGHGAAGVVLIGAAVFTGQLSIGWSNDWVDNARDRATGRTAKPVAAGQVPVRVVGVAAGLALAATIALSALLGGLAEGDVGLAGWYDEQWAPGLDLDWDWAQLNVSLQGGMFPPS